MADRHKFYIDGEWVEHAGAKTLQVVNPATEEAIYDIALGSAVDVDQAVEAARAAFEGFARTSREERIALLERVIAIYRTRVKDIAIAISDEMGAPLAFAERAQWGAGFAQLNNTLEALKAQPAMERIGTAAVLREPVGAVGMITPWNWPMNQVTCKVAPALAAGCTMVLKPSEYTPTSALIFAEILHEAGVPKGVFNLINGLGREVGAALSAHPGLDMISFTGSTRAGIDVAQRAAATVKRVSQELGGKSANIILDDADFPKAVGGGTAQCFQNSGQTCAAPTRMLVPHGRMDEAAAIAKSVAEKTRAGDPREAATIIGPVVNRTQWEKIQALIQKGIDEGATLAAGGAGRPAGLNKGYYVRPTVFANVTNGMTVAREEIFGPVLSIIGYKDEEDAVRIANDTPYGLAGYVSSGDIERARRVARRLRAGSITLNSGPLEMAAPFGGYKQSGNGREWGPFGLEEFQEVKAVSGWGE